MKILRILELFRFYNSTRNKVRWKMTIIQRKIEEMFVLFFYNFETWDVGGGVNFGGQIENLDIKASLFVSTLIHFT